MNVRSGSTTGDADRHEEELARAYLLGLLDSERAEAFEVRVFDSDVLTERLEASRDMLVDDYVFARLANAERDAFEQHALADDAVVRRVTLVRMLVAEIVEAAEERAQSIRRARRLRRAIVWSGVAASLALAATIGYVAFRPSAGSGIEHPPVDGAEVRPPAQPTPPEHAPRPPESTNPQPLTAPKPAFPESLQHSRKESEMLVSLAGSQTRDATSERELRVGAGVGSVRFRLDPPGPGYDAYAAVLRDVKLHEVWRRDLPKTVAGRSRRLDVVVPADVLVSGTYLLAIEGAKPGGGSSTIRDYAFVVRSK